MTFTTAKANVKGWRYAALLDSDKEVIKPQNGNNKTAAQNVKEIEEILPSLPDGSYYLAVRNSPAAKFTLFQFKIGSEPKPIADNSISTADQYNHDLYAENIRLAVRNKELETLNGILEEKCAEYLQHIDDLEKELTEAGEQMGDGQSSVLETILMTALPQIMDKFTANGVEERVNGVQDDPANVGSPG